MRKSIFYSFFKVIINCCFAMAVFAEGMVSVWGAFQPREPENIKEILKKRKSF